MATIQILRAMKNNRHGTKIFLLAILVTISLHAVGQTQLIGMKGGISWTNISSSDFLTSNDSRNGFTVGLSYDYFLKKIYNVSAELIYNQRGFSNSGNFTNINGKPVGEPSTIKFNYDYVSLPLRTGLSLGKAIYGFGNIGIIPSFLVSAKTILPAVDQYGQVIGTETEEVTKNATRFDMAGMFEVGGGYQYNRYWLFTSLTYQYSFTTITNPDYFANAKIIHHGLTLALGLKYNLTKDY